MKLARCRYAVPDLEELETFYCGLLGMQAFRSGDDLLLGYDPAQCLLEFRTSDCRSFRTTPNSLYWKIGITLRNLDAAVEELRARGLTVSDPRQFLDVGYLCHLQDPKGFVIELLQQGFEGNHATLPELPGHPIAAQATLAHITLRCSDLTGIQRLCAEQLSMRLLSLQRITLPQRQFDLYFYGWSQEELPDPDPEAVANREWLYARPYSLLEIQHPVAPALEVTEPDPQEAGFIALGYEDEDGKIHYLSAGDLAAGNFPAPD